METLQDITTDLTGRVEYLCKPVWAFSHAPERLTFLLLSDVLAALQCLKGLLASGNLVSQAGELRCSRGHELLLLVHGFSRLWCQLQPGAQASVPAQGADQIRQQMYALSLGSQQQMPHAHCNCWVQQASQSTCMINLPIGAMQVLHQGTVQTRRRQDFVTFKG